ncbi:MULTISPECIES: hypothetical protein [Spirulina sp. CCY15215]|uniref:hypothetical protein n=1 Tax=Spirulina sp. CCY15215 TaxID=2767591 RepID=UPI00194FE1BC|nr:hypothetical protein [Spirulina major]
MSQNSEDRDLLPPPRPDNIAPLSAGNVVSVAFVIYRSHFRTYVGIALRAMLWAAIPFLFLITLGIAFMFNAMNGPVIALSILLLLITGIYCWTKSFAHSVVITRLTFYELANRPETVQTARSLVLSRLWRFFWTGLLLFGIAIGLYIGIVIICGIAIAIITLIFGAIAQGSASPLIIAVLFSIIIVLAMFTGVFWLVARLFLLAEVPLATAIEELSPSDTIGQSWSLTKNNGWRIVAILTIACLITLPIAILIQVLSLVIQPLILLLTANSSTPAASLAIGYIVIYGISLVSNIIIVPFWQTLKGVLYYDLKSRGEGLDLKIVDS